MLPTPEETILPAIKSVTPTGSYLVGIQLHFTPGLLKKGGNAQNRIFALTTNSRTVLFMHTSSRNAAICIDYRRHSDKTTHGAFHNPS